MTTIAAKVAPNGKVRIAWDTQTTAGSHRKFGNNKVSRINGQFAVGVAGHVRYSNILQRTAVNKIHPHDLTQSDFDSWGWVLDELVPAWMKALRKEMENRPDEEDEIPWGHALIALAGRLFTVGSDFAVCTPDEFAVIGSGTPYAETALFLGKTPKQAVEVATALDMFSGGEVREMLV